MMRVRDYKLPPVSYYLGLIALIGATLLIALTANVTAALQFLALALGAMALIRLIAPEGWVAQVRSKTADVFTLVILALALWYFAQWGLTPHLG